MWLPLAVSLVLTSLASLVSWGIGFGVMTNCTNAHALCSDAGQWLDAGRAAQGALLVVDLALVVLAARLIRPHAVRAAAVAVAAASVAVLVVTTALAESTF